MDPLTYLKIGASVVALLAAGAVGYELGHTQYLHLQTQVAQQATKSATTEVIRIVKAQAVSTQVAQEDADQQAQVRTVTQTIVKEVPKYVTQTVYADRVVHDGGLPVGFVWNHNQAASGDPTPAPTGTDLDAPSGVDLSALANTIADNYGLYHSCRASLSHWEEWYAKEKSLADQAAPTN